MVSGFSSLCSSGLNLYFGTVYNSDLETFEEPEASGWAWRWVVVPAWAFLIVSLESFAGGSA
jgi:hypothetical protein